MFISSIKFCLLLIVFLLFWQYGKEKNSKKESNNLNNKTILLVLATFGIYYFSSSTNALYYFIPWVLLVWLSNYIEKRLFTTLSVLTGVFYIFIWKIILVEQQSENHWTTREPIFLPLGLSIFVFQGISYILELRKGNIEKWNLGKIIAFCGFFPTLGAGPIQNATYWDKKFKNIHLPNVYTLSKAFSLFAIGFFYKFFVSSQFYHYDNLIFLAPFNYGTSTLLLGVYAFSMEIYTDFNGWSMMAQAVCLLIGMPIGRNFNQPYLSPSIQTFWHRWHIALSDFFKRYIYIDLLGGNRHGKMRQIINIFLTMAISGLWHGLNSGFLIWGALHASANSLNHITHKKIKLPHWLSVFLTFNFVAFTWVFFKCRNWTLSKQYFQALAHWDGYSSLFAYWDIILLLILAIIFHVKEKQILFYLTQFGYKVMKFNYLLATLIGALLITLIYLISPEGVPPFIYFNF